MSSNKHYWLKSGIITIFQNFSNTLINLSTFYILVRLLSKNDYGVWGIFLQTVVIVEIVRSGLIQSALIKFISGSEKDQHAKIISASISISGVLTFICIIGCFLFAGSLARLFNSPQLEPMFYWYSIVFFLSGLLTIFNCIEQANFSYSGVFVSNLVRNMILGVYLIVVYALDIGTDLITLIFVQIGATIVAVLIAWLYVKKYVQATFEFSVAWVKKIFHYGKYAFATSVSAILSGTIDQWMLAGMISPSASGAFNIAVRVGNLVDIPTNAVATIVFPQSAKRIETDGKEAIKYLYEKSVGTILAIVLPVILFIYIFDKIIIELLAGDKYADTVAILNVTLLYCILGPFGRQVGVILDSIGKTRTTFFIVIFNTVVILAFNLMLIPKYGVMGAAYGTLSANIIGFIIGQAVLWKELKVNSLNAFIYAYRFYPEFFNKYILKK